MGRLGVVTAAVAGIAVFAGTERALDASLALRASWPRDVDTLVLPRSGVLGALSLGHRELAADLVAARANIYFGTQLASHEEQRRLALVDRPQRRRHLGRVLQASEGLSESGDLE